VVDAVIELDPLVSPGTRMLILSEHPAEVRADIMRRRMASRKGELRNIEVTHAVGNSLSRTCITAAVEHLLHDGGGGGGSTLQLESTPPLTTRQKTSTRIEPDSSSSPSSSPPPVVHVVGLCTLNQVDP
jgi:hypothetical protein